MKKYLPIYIAILLTPIIVSASWAGFFDSLIEFRDTLLHFREQIPITDEPLFGAPLTFIATPATTTVSRNFGFTIGTTTNQGAFGSTTLAVYGSTTLQTWLNTLYALDIRNAASTSIFTIDTINSRASTSNLIISNLGNSATNCLQATVAGLVQSSGAACGGGSGNAEATWQTVATNAYIQPTTTIGFIVAASSTLRGDYRVQGHATTTGAFEVLGAGTSTRITNSLQVGNIINVQGTSASSTFANGIQLTSGCFLLPSGSCAGTGGGTPGGADTQIQYNNASAFGGASNFVYQNSRVGIGTTTPGALLSLAAGDFLLSGANIRYASSSTSTIGAVLNAFSIATSTASAYPLFSLDGRLNYVGIGTTSPFSQFAIEQYGTTSNVFSISDQGTSSPSFIVLGNQFVGVGTTTPAKNFSVLGNGLFSGDLSAAALTATGTVNFSCTACITDANVADTITLTNITQITNRAITDTTGTLTETRGGTNQTTYSTGDTLYASAANTLSKLTVGASSTVYTTNGTIPAWSGSPSLLTLRVTNAGTSTILTDGLQVGGTIRIQSTTATSTGANGWDITAGCFSINGTCVGSPGGSNTQFQYNNGGTFAGATNLVYSNNRVGVATTTFNELLTVGGNGFFGGNLTATGTLTVSGSGTSTFTGGLTTNQLAVTAATSTRKNLNVANFIITNLSDTVQRIAHSFDNVLSNSSFEYWPNGTTVDPNGWTTQNATVRRVATSTQGSYAAEVTFNASDDQIRQSFPVNAGVAYTYTIWYTKRSGTGTGNLVAQEDGADFTEYATTGLDGTANATWRMATVSFIKPNDGTANVRLKMSQGDGTASDTVWVLDEMMAQEGHNIATAWRPNVIDDSTNSQNIFGDKNIFNNLLIQSTGKLGIATNTPGTSFSIAGGDVLLSGANMRYASSSTTTLPNNIDALRFASSSVNSATLTIDAQNGRVGIGSTTPAFPLSVVGGCEGCTDIVIGGGINLRNAKYVKASSTAMISNTFIDFYTAPTGKRAIAMVIAFSNYSGGTIGWSLFHKISGTYYRYTATTSTANNSITNSNGLSNIPDFVLEPGESIGILTNANGGTVYSNIIEYDSSVPLFTKKLLNPVSGTTTIYTVPTGFNAKIMGLHFALGSEVINDNRYAFFNNSSTTINRKVFAVEINGTASDTVNKIFGHTVVSANSINTGASDVFTYNSGGSVQSWLSANSLDGSWLGVTVVEKKN